MSRDGNDPLMTTFRELVSEMSHLEGRHARILHFLKVYTFLQQNLHHLRHSGNASYERLMAAIIEKSRFMLLHEQGDDLSELHQACRDMLSRIHQLYPGIVALGEN